jgi:hypothetical protein
MRSKGERWTTRDGREVVITQDLANNWVRILNESGKLEVIQENMLKEFLNRKDSPPQTTKMRMRNDLPFRRRGFGPRERQVI